MLLILYFVWEVQSVEYCTFHTVSILVTILHDYHKTVLCELYSTNVMWIIGQTQYTWANIHIVQLCGKIHSDNTIDHMRDIVNH